MQSEIRSAISTISSSYGDPVAPESPEGGPPVGIIAGTGLFRVLLAEGGNGEQLFLAELLGEGFGNMGLEPLHLGV